MQRPLALATAAVAIACVAIVIHVDRRIGTLEETTMQTETAHFTIRKADGSYLHVGQFQAENASDFAARVRRALETGSSGRESPKVETWTDKDGNEHSLSLEHDPAWTVAEWCKRFDNLVLALQEEFPCIE